MNVLITGLNSYLAGNLSEELNNNDDKVTLCSVRNGIDDIELDNIDVVVHCAAIVHNKKASTELYKQVNVDLTVSLAKKAKENGCKGFCFISSMAVFGKTENITRHTRPTPVSEYAKSKLAAERQLLKLASTDFFISIVRPPMIYGRNCPGNYGILSDIVQKSPFFPDSENCKSFIYIDNLTSHILQVIHASKTIVTHPTDEKNVSVFDFAREIALCHGKKLFQAKIIGALLKNIKFSVINKAFGNAYYNDDIATRIKKVSFADAVKLTENVTV